MSPVESSLPYTASPCHRICLYGGAGIGKSALAAHLYDRMKCLGLKCELVTEAIKPLAYAGRAPTEWENFDNIFAGQLKREREFLEHGVPVISCSPLWLQAFYMMHHHCLRPLPAVEAACQAFEEQYPARHIFLKRGSWVYQQEGRYETEDQAIGIDTEIQEYVYRCLPFEAKRDRTLQGVSAGSRDSIFEWATRGFAK